MQKRLFGAFIGAILVFGWQAMSHMVMLHHNMGMKQVPGQEEAIKTLSQIFKDEGRYIVPRVDPVASKSEKARFEKSMNGKPWAIVTYHPRYNIRMGLSVARSFVIALICVMLLIYILGKNPGNFSTILFKSIAWGLFAFLFVWYNNHIWLQTPWSVLWGELIDLLIAWTLCGFWLGYWLKSNQSKRVGYGMGFGI